MKKLASIIALSFLIIAQSCAQKAATQSVPEAVKLAFSQKFPNAKNVIWEKEHENEWEAEFKMNGKEYSANFTDAGEWQETEYEISKSEVPKEMISILDRNFLDYDIEGVEIAETPQGKSYEFEIEQGEEEFEVIIYSNGKVTKKKEDDENEDNDEN